MTDHDQRFKVLLKRFFGEFFQLFFPDWVSRFDFTQVEWLDKEIFTDPPRGERRYLDLVARVPVCQPVGESWVVLIHIEIEHEDKVARLRPRMFAYYEPLRRLHGLPVLPIGLYLRVGLQGVGWDVYEEYFWEHRLLRFEYAYIGLPALDGAPHMAEVNLLGVALAAFMRIPEERRAELKAEALQRVRESHDTDERRFLVAECVQAYWILDQAQQEQFDQLLTTEKYRGVKEMMTTMFEQGIEKGLEQGIEKGLQQGREQGFREMLRDQLEARFGPLSEQARQRLASWPAERLRELGRALLTAHSLQELGLED